MTTRMTVPVEAGELDVLVGGPDAPSAGTVCTMHPLQPMHDALPLIAEITQARVVSVSPRGAGGSSPPERPVDVTLEGMADDLEAVRRAIDRGRWVIWGMSGGSMIAQVYAHRHPAGAEALILDSAGACFSETLRDPECVLSPLCPRWVNALAAAAGAGDSARWEEVPDVGWALRQSTGAAMLVAPTEPTAQMRRVMPSLLAFDARPWLGTIAVPTLVLGGAADDVAPPAHLRALQMAVPGSSLALIGGAGHVPMGQQPAEVAAVVRRFLADRVWTDRPLHSRS